MEKLSQESVTNRAKKYTNNSPAMLKTVGKFDIPDISIDSNPALSADNYENSLESKRFKAILNELDKLSQHTVPEKYPYKLAVVRHHDYNMSKRWYVEYYAWDVSIDKLVRMRIFEPMNREKSLSKRLNIADEIRRVVNNQLLQGKCLGKDKIVNTSNDLRKLKVLEAVDAFVSQKEADNLRKNYLKRFETFKNNWQLWLDHQNRGDLALKELTSDQVYAYFNFLQSKRKIGNKSFNNYRADLSVFVNWIMKRVEGIWKISPIDSLPLLKVITRKHAAYTDEQIKAIKVKCEALGFHQLLLMIHFLYYTLARPGELRQLKIFHLELEANRIFIPGDISKNRRDEYVPIAPGLRKAIEESSILKFDKNLFIFGPDQAPGERMPHKNAFWVKNVKVLNALEFNDREYDVYGYKHSGAINLYKATKDIKLVQHICRHSTTDMTNVYLRDLGLLTDYESLNQWKGAL